MKRSATFVLSLTIYLLFAAAASHAQTASQSALVEGAKKEGKLVWYTSMAIDTSKPLLDAFVKEYPFIKADLVRAGEEQLMNRVLSETRAGQWLFDAISTSAMGALVDRHLITPYVSSERDAFLNEFKDPQGYWTGVFVNNLVLCYNTKMLAAKDAPRRRGHGLTAQLLGAGEVPLAWAYNFRIERMKNEGAPVEWIESFDPIVVTLSGMGLSTKASNPNSAKLLIDFATSKKGQQMVRGMRRIPARSDIEPLAPKMDQTKLKLKAVPKEVYLHLDDYAREFRKIFGL